jgi:hypothetical protein
MESRPYVEARVGWGTRSRIGETTMKRTIFLIMTILLVMGGSIVAASAKDDKDEKDSKDDTRVTAEACKKNGWRDLEDADGDPFKSQGQCVSYAKQGGEVKAIEPGDDDDFILQEADDSGDKAVAPTVTAESVATREPTAPVLTIIDGTKPWDGYLEGAGFTPGETLTEVTFASERETLSLSSPVGTVINEDGTFTTERIIYWCSEYHGYDEATGTVTVEDSSGKTYSQTLEMADHCGQKE